MPDKNLPAPTPRAPMQIKNLVPGLMEMGKIKIGRKGDARQGKNGTWQMPQKLDHFIVTTMERGQDNNFVPDAEIHAALGPTPREIPIRLLYDDPALNFPTRYSCYYGKTLFCSGDGETAQRLRKDGSREAVQCPCNRQDPTFAGDDGKGKGKCKINGVLSVMIEGAEVVGGVWKFRTTSYNSVVGILSSMALIRRITGGRLAGIPLRMTVTPKSVADPIHGSQQTVYVVGLQYRGTVESLQNTGYQIAMTEAQHGIRVEQIETEARRMLAYEPPGDDPLGVDDVDDVVDEFYPEEAAAEAGVEMSGGAPELVEPQVVQAEEPPKDLGKNLAEARKEKAKTKRGGRKQQAQKDKPEAAEKPKQAEPKDHPADEPPPLAEPVDAVPVDESLAEPATEQPAAEPPAMDGDLF
jgi:hypothetical protein